MVTLSSIQDLASRRAESEVSIRGTRRFEFNSDINGRRYVITLALPVEPHPATACRVLFVLDGDLYFASAVEAVRSHYDARDVVVVGIGHPDDPAWVKAVLARRSVPASLASSTPLAAARAIERRYDFTLPVAKDARCVPGLSDVSPHDVGGLDEFLEVIEMEIKPRVSALVSIDKSNQAIFGHSLGGLAVIHALFTAPTSFKTFVASSPSLWWNHGAVLTGERNFGETLRVGRIAPRVLITVGGDEEKTPKLPRYLGVDSVQLETMVRNARMVANARELTERLQALTSPGPCEIEDCVVFENTGHVLAAWPALARTVEFAFGGQG